VVVSTLERDSPSSLIFVTREESDVMSVFTTTNAPPSDLCVVPLQASAATPRLAGSVVVTTTVKPDATRLSAPPIGFVADDSALESGLIGGGMFFATDANAAWRPLSPLNRSPG
jgi:hypothetical protein